MDEKLPTLREMVSIGASFMEIVDVLKRREGGSIRPIEFLQIFQVELGISFTLTRDILEYFNPDMHPIVDEVIINDHGRALLRGVRPPDDHQY